MKPELTNELKEKFFALHWGQRIAYCTNSAGDIQPYGVLSNCLATEVHYLLLKPLSAITDEDAIEAWNLFLKGNYEETIHLRIVKRQVAEFLTTHKHSWVPSLKIIGLYQYLQSKGYALPWYSAEPKRVVSIEEQVQAGWIKLTA